MAIKSNKKIDFEYEFINANSEDTNSHTYSFSLRFYTTEEYGPTIAFLDEEGEPVVNFPVAMFTEVSEFLIEQGIISGKKTLPMPQAAPKPLKTSTTATTAKLSLPKPRIVSSKNNSVSVGKRVIEDVPQFDLADEEVEESIFMPEEIAERESQRLQDIHDAVEGTTPAQSLSSSAQQNIEISEEEAKAMLEQRKAALSKKDKVEKSIRRKE